LGYQKDYITTDPEAFIVDFGLF